MSLFNWKSVGVCALLSAMALGAPAFAADPNGSRYDDWSQNEVWLAHYGRYTDSGWVSSKYPRMFGDINGDGMQDVVAFGQTGVYIGISNGTSFINDSNVWVSAFGYGDGWRVGTDPRFTADMNGDGKDDLVGFGNDGVYVAISTGTSFNAATRWSDQFASSVWPNSNWIRTLGDVNGDGHPDAVGFGTDGVYVGLADPTNSKFGDATRWIENYGTDQAWNTTEYTRLLADVNADGKDDIIGYGIQGTYVSLAQSNNTFNAASLVVANFGSDQMWSNAKHLRTAADVNGDGKADLVGFGDTATYVGYSNGTNTANSWTFATLTDQFSLGSGWTNDGTLRIMTDVNSDGKADIVGFNAPGMQVALAQGQDQDVTYSTAKQWVNDFGSNQAWVVGESPRFMVDVNGDGRPEPAGYGYYGVYVSASASLYCCDKVNFLDTGSNPPNKQVDGAWIGRTYLPRAQLVLNAPNKPTTCENNPTYKNPVEPIVANSTGYGPWSNQYSARLFINANFFDINAGNPYTTPCTTALGWTIGNTETVSTYGTVHGGATQTMAFFTPAHAQSTGIYAEILGNNAVSSQRDNIQNAVSGFTLVSDGQFNDQSSGIAPTTNRARAGIGLTQDGKTLILAIVNNGNDGGTYPNGGTTLKGLADLLIANGAYSALTLDGSGSSQLVFSNGAVTYKSVGSDNAQGGTHQYRPVPIFLGVR
ncbi:phosphodiester glycosidase family protein [Maritalea myrionectae]|uniref:phosphodiester glycosidase family protein n=1 Tax=Maritalea myrionectae TaxID=454601 RepID=UPI0003FB9E43|nr:phosphodiester glycosidase family protein [Maritalea myrionectae]